MNLVLGFPGGANAESEVRDRLGSKISNEDVNLATRNLLFSLTETRWIERIVMSGCWSSPLTALLGR